MLQLNLNENQINSNKWFSLSSFHFLFPFCFYWNRYVQFEESATNAEDAAVHCSAARETFVYLSTRDSHHLTNIKIAIVLQEWRENRERYLISDSDHEHWINLPILSSFFHKSFFFWWFQKFVHYLMKKKYIFCNFEKRLERWKKLSAWHSHLC